MDKPKVNDAAVAVAVFTFGFALFWMFRSLGWFAQDEGVLYYHYLRTHQGQLPYRDFFTGYGPVTLYLHSLLFSILGVSVDATRVYMAGVNALSGVLLYLVTRRVASWPFAVVPALLFCTLQPGDIADMAFHNTPYPLWYLVTLFSFAAWAMLRAIETERDRSRAGWMFLVGLIGGLALFTKQNGGVFILWGATGFLASYPLRLAGPGEAPIWRIARGAYLWLMPLSMMLLSWTFTSPWTVAAYVVPMAALAWIGTSRAFSRDAIRVALVSISWMAAGVVVAIAPWFLFFADRIGAWEFIKALFFWGKYVDRMIFLAYPMPGQLAAFVLAVVAVLWSCAAIVGRHGWHRHPRWVRPLVSVLLVGLFGGTAAFLGFHWIEIRRLFMLHYNPWRMYREASLALDSTFAYLVFPVLLGGLMLAWGQRKPEVGRGGPPAPAFLCLLWMAVCCFLLYYPRMDAAHFVSAAVLLYCVGATLAESGGAWLVRTFTVRGPRLRRLGLAVAAIFILFAANLKMAPKVYSVVMFRKDGEGPPLIETPREEYNFDRVHVYFPIYEKTHRRTRHAFVEAIDYVRANTAPDEPIFAFPAYPMVYFASERNNPTRHDYFLSNNVPFDEQIRLLKVLEESRVKILVLPSDENDYFVEVGRPYHDLLWAYFRQEYFLERRFGPYDVWRRFDGPGDVASAHS